IDRSGLDARLPAVRFEAVSDVDNPLLGPQGAASVFAPQKGADAETIQILEEIGKRFADAVESAFGRRFRDLPGSGAAGGLGFGLLAFFGAEIRSGIETIIEAARLRGRAEKVDLLVTGEGRLDAQSRHGKTAAGIAALAREAGRPCVAFCGSVDGPATAYVPEMFAAVWEIRAASPSLEEAIARAALYLEITARRSARDVAALASRA
ncbi:MAG: glycerate kinase, partial [Candidatus Aminicenantales bacterium]